MGLARGAVTHEEADPPPAAATSSGDESAPKLTIEDRFRGVSIGMKLADMAAEYGLGDEVRELWLTWSVEEVLKMIRSSVQKKESYGQSLLTLPQKSAR